VTKGRVAAILATSVKWGGMAGLALGGQPSQKARASWLWLWATGGEA